MGHAVLNDVKYLNLETRRFRLPSFEFEFSDSQLMFMTHINDFSRQFGLEHIANELGVEFTPHRAADDAYATMRIVEALCKAYSCSPQRRKTRRPPRTFQKAGGVLQQSFAQARQQKGRTARGQDLHLFAGY